MLCNSYTLLSIDNGTTTLPQTRGHHRCIQSRRVFNPERLGWTEWDDQWFQRGEKHFDRRDGHLYEGNDDRIRTYYIQRNGDFRFPFDFHWG